MGIRNIDFGSFPDDPSADAIRTAFRKTQENFNELFAGQQDQAVLSVNRTAGAGISVNTPTGNVVVSARIACVQIQSSTLGLGVSSGNTSNNAVITDGSTPFIIDLPESISNVGNISLSGTLTANTVNVNLALNGNVGIFSGNLSAANLAASVGLEVTGNANVGNIGATNGVFSGNISGNYFNGIGVVLSDEVQAVTGNFSGNIQSLNADLGNAASANFFVGDGGLLTNVIAAASTKIENGNSEANLVAAGGNLAISIGGNSNVMVVSDAGAEIVGTFSATGNSNVGNLGAVHAILTGNANAINFNGTNVIVSGNVEGTIGAFTGNLSAGNADLGNAASANFFVGDGGLLSNISVSAGSYIANGTSNAYVVNNGNIVLESVGNTILVVTDTGANITGYANVDGNLVAGNVSATLFTGTLETASQPNVTSLGTLSALTVEGISNLGDVGNLRITGGTNAQVMISNGAGGLSWITAAALTFAPGANTQVLYNDDGNFAASAGMVFDNTANILTVDGNVDATNINATLISGTLSTASQPNITSVGSLTSLIVSGNINTANIVASNYANAKFSAIGSGTITNTIPALELTQIWNNSSETFTAISMDITDTDSNAGSLLMDLQVGSSTQFSITKDGNATASQFIGNGSQLTGISSIANGTSNVNIASANGNIQMTVAGTEQTRIIGTANATNYITLTGSNGGAPQINTSAGHLRFGANTKNTTLEIRGVNSSGNYWVMYGGSGGLDPTITLDGTGANIPLTVSSKGSSPLIFQTSGSSRQFLISHTAGSQRYVTVTGAGGSSAANVPIISTNGPNSGNIGFGSRLLLTGSESLFSTLMTNSTEKVTVSATAATGTINYYPTTQSVLYYTSNASANWTMNFAASANTTMNNVLGIGETITVVFLATQGATAYYPNVHQVDGSNVTPLWQGGTAPTEGTANSIDAYSYTIIKTAANTYTMLASQTPFA